MYYIVAYGLLQLNETLRVLDLAWNGIADEGAHILGAILLYSTVLRELDITCNRISLEGCLYVCQGLLKNTTLKVLKVCFIIHSCHRNT